jgi:hypothetical protein
MSTWNARTSAQPVQHDELQCQMDGRISTLVLDLGLGSAGALPMLPAWERLALASALCELYMQLPPGRGAST